MDDNNRRSTEIQSGLQELIVNQSFDTTSRPGPSNLSDYLAMNTPTTSTVHISASADPITSATNANSSQLVLVDKGLSVSRMMDEKLHKLENILICRLRECKLRIKEIQKSEQPQSNNKNSFRYVYCGKPYFKDTKNVPAPCDEDTIVMQKHQMYDFSTIASVPGWTVKDKSDFITIVLKMSQDIKINELNLKISSIQRQAKLKNIDDSVIDKDVEVIRKEIEAVSKKNLKDIALPIDQEYDWENIAYMLNQRHSAQEYSSLWKVFLHPSVNKNNWSKSEHSKLYKIASVNNYQDWDKIATELNTGRTGYQCFVYYRTNMNCDYAGQKWTKEEEEYLTRAIEFYREGDYIPWGKVAASMENRTKISVYNKYRRLAVKRKGRFLPEEDAVILTCAEDFGTNFQRMKKHLPGRSVAQLRVRYKILMKRGISTVWTVEEDKKLIELMVNQEDMTNWSNITQFFPGKDRTHLRARYIILVKWMKQYPHIDISYAPRRGARRLKHGQASNDLDKAVTKLANKIDSQSTLKAPKGITMNSPEHEIDNAIIAQLAKELAKDSSEQLYTHEEKFLNENTKISSENMNTTNLQKILILLRSRIDENSFKDSSDYKKYCGVDDSKQTVSLVQVKSYSRKNKPETIKLDSPDIYGRNQLPIPKYVLPPHFATIVACRKLIGFVDETHNLKSYRPVLSKKNPILKDQMAILIERFNTLFLWPQLLSNRGRRESRMTSATTAVSSDSESV